MAFESNESIKLQDKTFNKFISAAQIESRILELVQEVQKTEGGELVFLVIMNGAIHFASDFTRLYPFDCPLYFITASSYQNASSTGVVEIIGLEQIDIFQKKIIILEDIIETGFTLYEIKRMLVELGAISITLISLFYKPESLKYPTVPDYFGFEISTEFIVGYGLDYNGLGRTYPDVYQLINAI